MKFKTIKYDNCTVTVHIPETINYLKLKNETMRFMKEVIKKNEVVRTPAAGVGADTRI